MSAAAPARASRPALRVAAWVGAAFALGILIALVGARYAEGDAAVLLSSVGPLTTLGLPVTAVLGSSLAALSLGGAILAGWLLPRDKGWADASRRRILVIVTGTSIGWTFAAIAQLLLSYSLSSGQAVSSPRFGSDIGVYMVSDLGVWMLWGAILAGATTAVALAGGGVRIARAAAVVAALGIVARAMTGHAAGSASHESATSSMFLHLVAVAAWVGPLVLLQVLPDDSAEPATWRRTVRRFSSLALVAWVLLAASGTVALVSRVSTLDQVFTTAYGQLGLLKIVILVILGVFGAMQRSTISRTSRRARQAFRRLALIEIGLMAAAIGLGAAMSSSPPPAENVPPPASPAGILTSYALPPPPVSAEALTQVRPDVFAIALAALALTWWYARGRREGTGWLLAACLAYVLITSGPLGVYARVLFSAHLAEKIALLVAVGLPLSMLLPVAVVGRITAALARPTRWVPVALVPGAVLALCYFQPDVLRRILESHPANVGFALVCIALGVLWGVLWRGARLPALVAGLGIIGVAQVLAHGTVVLAPSWFGAMGRTWWAHALSDQQAAGWALSGAIALILVAGMIVARHRPLLFEDAPRDLETLEQGAALAQR
ncbi:MAG: CopD family protein [Dermabacter sp.]|nr:CopD family protein [Dermabacter sp.]